MLNGEPIEEEDLVLYFNLGGHHVPTSQDVPNTLMHTSASSVMLVPFNYFDGDESLGWRQGVRIERAGGKEGEGGGDGNGNGEGDWKGEEGKEEMRKAKPRQHARSNRVVQGAIGKQDKKNKDKNEGITFFGAYYKSPVLVAEEQLTPDLRGYMKERDDGEGGWRVVRNRVGGGLWGLFAGREGAERGGRMDW